MSCGGFHQIVEDIKHKTAQRYDVMLDKPRRVTAISIMRQTITDGAGDLRNVIGTRELDYNARILKAHSHSMSGGLI